MIKTAVIRGYRIFDDVRLDLNPGVNIVVGANECGKSTLLEAVSMTLRGQSNGRWIREELNPYWFHAPTVERFFNEVAGGRNPAWPEILIELYLEDADPQVQKLRGRLNSLAEDAPGVSVTIGPSEDYATELHEFLLLPNHPRIVPVEYYKVSWCDFAGQSLGRTPRGLGISVIDSRTIRGTSGLDYHTRQLLADRLDDATSTAISVAMRLARQDITNSQLSAIEAHRNSQGAELHDRPIHLQMDQSASAAWQNAVVPTVDGIPFALAGEGQQASIKVALAMAGHSETTKIVLVEEPENHLSYTRLTRLVQRISSLAGERQLLVTTHSSYVLNRLGLDRLTLLEKGKPATFSALDSDTVAYFKKLSGYDTLRVVLADHVVLVEGPADEMVFQRAYRDRTGHSPMDDGIDVISMDGLAFKRALSLARALGRRAAVVRDNDGKQRAYWEEWYAEWLEAGKRELFVGEPQLGTTLEPQVVTANGHGAMSTIFDAPELLSDDAVIEWMTKNKTDAALKILESTDPFKAPPYMEAAVDFANPRQTTE